MVEDLNLQSSCTLVHLHLCMRITFLGWSTNECWKQKTDCLTRHMLNMCQEESSSREFQKLSLCKSVPNVHWSWTAARTIWTLIAIMSKKLVSVASNSLVSCPICTRYNFGTTILIYSGESMFIVGIQPSTCTLGKYIALATTTSMLSASTPSEPITRCSYRIIFARLSDE